MKHSARAVTLLEALTVLVIIGIVVFVTLPHLTQSKSNADLAAAKAKATQLNIAKDAYIAMLGAEQAQINWAKPSSVTSFNPRLKDDDNGRFMLIRSFINPPVPATVTKLMPEGLGNSPSDFDKTVFSTYSYRLSFYPFNTGNGAEKIIGAPVIINGDSANDDMPWHEGKVEN